MTETSPTVAATTATRKAALWIAAVFILSLALGGVAGYSFARRGPAQLSDEARRHQKIAELTKLLTLAPEQQAQMDAIFTETQGQFQAVHKQTDPLIEAVRQRARDRIRAVLTPEQKPQFEEFLRKMDEERKNHPSAH
jgi:Spy/CpxP family protein refolding chaperone